MKRLAAIGAMALALIAISCAGRVKDEPINTPQAAPFTSATGEVGVSPSAQPTKPCCFEEGAYEVGTKSDPDAGTIKPGTFVLVTSDHCYWERLQGFSGEMNDIIANGNLDAPEGKTASARITIKKGDKGLSLSGSCLLGQKGGLK